MGKTNKDQEISLFDKKDIWDKECRPLFERLTELLNIYGFPYFIAVCTASRPTETEYVTDTLLPDVKELNLYNDYIRKHLQVHLGYEVSLHRQDVVLDMDDIDDAPDPDEITFD